MARGRDPPRRACLPAELPPRQAGRPDQGGRQDQGDGHEGHVLRRHEDLRGTSSYNFDTLSKRLRELTFLNKGLRITLEDERDGKKHDFYYKGGIVEFVTYLNRNKETLHPKAIDIERERDGIQIEIAMQYNDGYQEQIFTYANSINTTEGGTHLSGFKAALTRTINNYGTAKGLFKDCPARSRATTCARA